MLTANVKEGKEGSQTKDYSIFICYDHRINDDLMKITKFLMDDIRSEEKNCFIQKVV